MNTTPSHSVLVSAEPVSWLSRQSWGARPNEPAIMYHSWRDLLFLHWRIDPQVVQRTLPQGLTVDTFEGNAWIGVVPFLMRRIRPWWAPSIPGLSNFEETNVRTYVRDDKGRVGVWFYALFANQPIGCWIGRNLFFLPYRDVSIRAERNADDERHYQVDFKTSASQDAKRSIIRYKPLGKPSAAREETLESFLVDRYLLFSSDRKGRLWRGQVHHAPYEIQPAMVECDVQELFKDQPFELKNRPYDHATFCAGVDVDVFALKR